MDQQLEQLVDEVGAADFRPLTDDRKQSIKNSSFRDYNPDANTTMTLDQAKRFGDAAEGKVSSTSFENDSEFFEVWERVVSDWPNVEVRFAGMIDEWGYLDTAFLVYEDVPVEPVSNPSREQFEEYAVVHFKDWVGAQPEDNNGVCAFCDDRIELGDFHRLGEDVLFRSNADDDNLWASPDEFDFREYPHFGECVRMWWDD